MDDLPVDFNAYKSRVPVPTVIVGDLEALCQAFRKLFSGQSADLTILPSSLARLIAWGRAHPIYGAAAPGWSAEFFDLPGLGGTLTCQDAQQELCLGLDAAGMPYLGSWRSLIPGEGDLGGSYRLELTVAGGGLRLDNGTRQAQFRLPTAGVTGLTSWGSLQAFLQTVGRYEVQPPAPPSIVPPSLPEKPAPPPSRPETPPQPPAHPAEPAQPPQPPSRPELPPQPPAHPAEPAQPLQPPSRPELPPQPPAHPAQPPQPPPAHPVQPPAPPATPHVTPGPQPAMPPSPPPSPSVGPHPIQPPAPPPSAAPGPTPSMPPSPPPSAMPGPTPAMPPSPPPSGPMPHPVQPSAPPPSAAPVPTPAMPPAPPPQAVVRPPFTPVIPVTPAFVSAPAARAAQPAQPAAPAGGWTLQVETGPAAGLSVPMTEGQRFSVGREKNNDLSVLDAMISRHHAFFSLSTGALLIEDLNSRNGVFVNGVRVVQNLRLKPDDVVQLGETRIRIQGPVEREASPYSEATEYMHGPLIATPPAAPQPAVPVPVPPAPVTPAQVPPAAVQPPVQAPMQSPVQPPAAQPRPSTPVCEFCGTPLSPNSKFCGNCGKPVSQPAQPTCPNCGQPVNPAARFCRNCGYQIHP